MWRVGLVGLLLTRVAAADCEIAAQPPVSIEVTGTSATLSFDGRTRVIEAKTCTELQKAVAVVIQMILSVPHDKAPAAESGDVVPSADAESTQNAPDDPVAPPTQKAARPLDPITRATVAADTNELEDSTESDQSSEVEHAVIASFGTSTSLGEALALGMRWRWDTVSVSTELAGELPGGIEMGANVEIVRASAAFVPCKHVRDFALCGVFRAGIDHGSGVDLMNARSATEIRADLGARLAWEYAVTAHLAIQLRAELDLATTTNQFDVDDLPVWRNSRFTGLAGMGVVMRFP